MYFSRIFWKLSYKKNISFSELYSCGPLGTVPAPPCSPPSDPSPARVLCKMAPRVFNIYDL